ncbi:endo-1,4-beta-xylanase [Saliphagus sp. LR7]|uniref:endo-1,4-beta-xylanase n=1 Tax=Saliphagus sp. LR7 TaxID=2282654 RepID=UPI000DF8181D|nr:endo-1,4-beta-xylanase [Saliphagus sp. LR7]
MTDNDTHSNRKRRSFLQAMAAAGLGATVGSGRAVAQSDSEDLDSYHQALRDTLTGEEGLPEGEFVYGTSEDAVLEAFALDPAESGTETVVDVNAEVPITRADRVEMTEVPENPYAATYRANVPDRSFEEGDVLLAVVYLRGVGTASAGDPVETQAGFKWQYTNPDGSTGYSENMIQGTVQVSPGQQWQRYYFPIEVIARPDGSAFQPYTEFWTGYSEQTIEFGGLALVDYGGTDVAVGDLPTSSFDYDYPGRAEDAAWRDAAEQRIEEIRTTDLEVTVVDEHGDPVEGATVDVAMQEHAFDFGSAVSAAQFPDGNETYRETFLENFNKAVPENGLKVPAWEGEYGESLDRDNTRAAIDWLTERDIPTRGHALVWSTYDWMGIDSDQSAAAINEEVKRLIRERADEFEGRLPEWDMHNHPLFYPEIWEDIGREYVLDWWETAHEAVPDSRMYINEINILNGNLADSYYDHIGWLQDNGADVEGIGFMSHFTLGSLTPPSELVSTFDRFAEFGVPLQLTEFDVQINDRGNENEVETQADYVRDVLTAAFSHEAVDGVMSWGFWPDEHWRPTAAYYDSDWSLRPHGEVYRDLVLGEWWTDVSGETESGGVYAADGFKGTYEITARADGSLGATTVTVDDENGSATVELSPASVADVELDVPTHTLEAGETTDIGVTLVTERGRELEASADSLSFETDDASVLTVDDEGVVVAADTGTATVTAVATAYGDTAAASATITVNGDESETVLEDDATDLSKTDSNANVTVGSRDAGFGEDSWFQKSDAGVPSSVTYRAPNGFDAFDVTARVNYSATNQGEFEDLVLEASAEGDSFEAVDASHEVVTPANDSNGYYAEWRYAVESGIPEDATHLRITIPPTGANFYVYLTSVSLSRAQSVDRTGPSIVIDDLQADRTYEAPHEADVSVSDEGAIAERSVTLDGDSWAGGTLTARGRRRLAASATDSAGITTDLGFAFTVENADHDLIARQKPSATDATVGERLTFQVQDTTGNDRWIDSLEWSFGDGTAETGWWAAHRFEDPGSYRVSLTATDNQGRTTTDTVIVRVADLDGPLARAKPGTTEAAVGERITFDVEDATGEGRWIDSLEWTFGDGTTGTGWWVEHRYDETGTYTVALTATDNTDHSTTHEVEITVS